GALVTVSFTAIAQTKTSHRTPLLAPRQAGPTVAPRANVPAARPGPVSLFDGKTLNGWIDQENSAGSFSSGDIKDFAGFTQKLLVEDAFPDDLAKSPATGWIVKDGAIASTGAGRGTLYTTGDYGHFRLTFLMRHVSGSPDHQACVLIFCTRPKSGEKPLDALGGIQFQVPNGGHWDYRPGHNNGGGSEFTNLLKPGLNVHEWSQVE